MPIIKRVEYVDPKFSLPKVTAPTRTHPHICTRTHTQHAHLRTLTRTHAPARTLAYTHTLIYAHSHAHTMLTRMHAQIS